MGCSFSSYQTGGLARQHVSEEDILRGKNIVQICVRSSGMFVCAASPEQQGDITKHFLFYQSSLGDDERIYSYFELLSSGVIRHFATGLYVMSEIDDISNGYAIALRQGPVPETREMAVNFGFTFTDKNFWQHNKSGLYVQPEGSSAHSGAKLMTYPLPVDGHAHMEFRMTPVPYERLTADLERKNMLDAEAKFATSSDGIALEKAALNAGNRERESLVEMNYADIACIELGINRLTIATFADPVKNLSISNTGVYSLQLHSDEAETWSIFMSDPNLPRPRDSDSVYGRQIQIRNFLGKPLSCTSDGRLCCDEGAGDVWNVLLADKNMYFIVNNAFPFALSRWNDNLTLVPKTTPADPAGTMYWNIYNQ